MDSFAGAIAGVFVLIIAACAVALGKRKPVPVLTLPHPEEPADDSRTVANTSLAEVLFRWFAEWNVPTQWCDYWGQAIIINVYDEWPDGMLPPETPAGTWTDEHGRRHLSVLARWLNPGVVSHEQAHNSYALLTEAEKQAFEVTYQTVSNAPLIVLLWSINTYGLSSSVECHAELYRYLGSEMPEALKRFYPRLFV